MAFAPSDLSGKKVLVTGASGFLGSAVMAQLASAGAEATGASRRARGQAGRSVEADLRTADVSGLLAELKTDVIIHCAGLGVEPRTEPDRALCWATNYEISERVLIAAAAQPVPPRVVLVSSAAIYAPMPGTAAALDEEASWRPSGFYGQSKAAAAMLARVMAARGDMPVSIAVPFNMIGRGQPAHQVPQTFINRLKETPDRLSVGDLSAVRDWTDVRDVARALLALAADTTPLDIYNIASGQGRSVRELLDRVCALGGYAPEITVSADVVSRRGVSRSVGDISRIAAATGWRPEYELDESLKCMFD